MLYGTILVLRHEKCYNSVRKTTRKSNKMNIPRPKICEGRMVPYAHKDDALEYQYLDKEGNNDCKANLCSRCVAHDRNRGYVMGRTFIEEKTNGNA
jgi:hypothetical protein